MKAVGLKHNNAAVLVKSRLPTFENIKDR